MNTHFYLSAAAALLLASCTTVTGISDGVEWALTRGTSHPSSFQVNKETVEISFDAAQSSDAEAQAAGGFATLAATYVAGEVIRGFEKTAKNYSITYSASTLGKNLSGMRGFTLTRKINRKVAATLHFTVHEYVGGYSYIALDSIKVDKSKTAVPFWDSDLDVIVELKISTPKAGVNSGTAVVTPGKLVVKDLKLGETRPTDGGLATLSSTGLYEPNSKPFFLEITVQEVSDFNDIAEKGATLIGKNKEDWQKKLADAIGGGS